MQDSKLILLQAKIQEYVCRRADHGDTTLGEAIDKTITELDEHMIYWQDRSDEQPAVEEAA